MMNFKLENKLDISDGSIDCNQINDKQFSTIDKVLRILKLVRYYLDISIGNRDMIKNLNWVIMKIETNSLYSNLYEETVEEDNKLDSEKSEFLEGFQEFSFVHNIQKQSRERMICKTAHLTDFKGLRGIFKQTKLSSKPVLNDPELKNVDEQDELNYIENRKGRKDLKKSGTVKSVANGKVEYILANELIPDIDEDKIVFETIKDEKVIHFEISSQSSPNTKGITSNESYNMNSVVSRNFNIFQFEHTFTREKLMILVGKELFRALDLINMIDQTKLTNFLTDLRNHYIPTNPYHSDRHGTDVGQTISTYLKESEIIDMCFLQDLDVLSMVIAALGHDVGHTGKNNNFHINSQSEYAITYHDKSVLENYHIYVVFKLLKKEENNILLPLKKEEFTIFRKRVIESILATDMSFHSKVLTNIKNKLFNWNEIKKTSEEELFINPASKTFFDEQQEVINLLIHAADIAHNTKPFVMSEKWTELLTEEFHLQGDKEKELGLPISFLCDRTTSNVPKSQIGFISFVIIPTFQLVTEVFPSLEYLLTIAKKNLAEWEIMHKANEEKKEKEEENKPK